MPLPELQSFTDEELLLELIERNDASPSPKVKKFHTPHSEIVIGIGNDDVAYINLDDESVAILVNRNR